MEPEDLGSRPSFETIKLVTFGKMLPLSLAHDIINRLNLVGSGDAQTLCLTPRIESWLSYSEAM